MWKLSVLRQFELRAPDGQEFQTRSATAREILCILALSGPKGVARDALANHLFGDHQDPEAGLNVQVSRLRTALAKQMELPLLQSTGRRLHLVNLDADAFRLAEAIEEAHPTPALIVRALSALEGPATADLVPGPYRSSLVSGLRDDLCARILLTLSRWAQSPHIERWRPQILRTVVLIQAHLPANAITVERLLHTFGALGLKEMVMKTYDDYQSFLEEEYGERGTRDIESLVEELITALDEQHRQINRFPEFEIPLLYGREAEMRHLITASQLPGVHIVAGFSGIGKTVLLKSFAASASLAGLKRSWIDLAYEDEERAFIGVLSQGPDAVFIDHYTPQSGAFVMRLRQALGAARIFVAGVSTSQISATTILMLQPLAVDRNDPMSPSLLLFLDRAAKYGAEVAGKPECAEIVEMSEGIPFVIDMIARLTAISGLAVTRQLLGRESTDVSGRMEQVWPSLLIATRASISALSGEAQTVISLLARLDSPVSSQLMLEAGVVSAEYLQELVASGLLRSDDGGASMQIQGVSGRAIKASTAEIATKSEFEAFVEGLTRCILQHPGSTLMASEASRRTAQTLVNLLVDLDERLGAELLDEVRQFLVAGSPIWLSESVLRRYVGSSGLSPRQSGASLLGYGAFLFAHTRYEEMLAALESGATQERLQALDDEYAANLLSQQALALRCLGRFEESIDLYQTALRRARSGGNNRTIAKISYNVAMAYAQRGEQPQEGIRHLDEAIELSGYVPNPAAKVELLHMRALLMNAAGIPLTDVLDEFRSALVYAAQFEIPMQVAWICQNMGLVYARHEDPGRAVLCEACGVYLAVGLPEGLGKEALRLTRSSLGTLGASLQSLGRVQDAVTCRSLMDRVGVYETAKQNETLVDTLKSKTYHGTVRWDEYPVTAEEVGRLCRRFLETILGQSPDLEAFVVDLDALSGGQLGKIMGGDSRSEIRE